MEKVQYLVLQTAKRVFLSKQDSRIIRFDEMVFNTNSDDLNNLMVIGVSYNSLPVRYRQYFKLDTKFDLCEFLIHSWTIGYTNPINNKKISGQPDKIILDENLAEIVSDQFFLWLKECGIDHEIVKNKNRHFSMVGKSHQDFPIVEPQPISHKNLKLTLDILNQCMQQKSRFDAHPSKEVKKILSLGLWDDEGKTYPKGDCHITIKDADKFLKKIFNGVQILNPQLIESHISDGLITYEKMLNNRNNEDKKIIDDENQELALIALSCMEDSRSIYSELLQEKIKHIKTNRWSKLKNINQADYLSILRNTGIKPIPHNSKNYIFDFSKLTEQQLSKLWNKLLKVNSITYEITTLCKNPIYKVYANEVDGNTYFFITKKRYRKWLYFEKDYCVSARSNGLFHINESELNEIIQSYKSGNLDAFHGIKYKLKNMKYLCG
jgi:hypothetical protein